MGRACMGCESGGEDTGSYEFKGDQRDKRCIFTLAPSKESGFRERQTALGLESVQGPTAL